MHTPASGCALKFIEGTIQHTHTHTHTHTHVQSVNVIFPYLDSSCPAHLHGSGDSCTWWVDERHKANVTEVVKETFSLSPIKTIQIKIHLQSNHDCIKACGTHMVRIKLVISREQLDI